jgi:hypothetical protein
MAHLKEPQPLDETTRLGVSPMNAATIVLLRAKPDVHVAMVDEEYEENVDGKLKKQIRQKRVTTLRSTPDAYVTVTMCETPGGDRRQFYLSSLTDGQQKIVVEAITILESIRS